MWLYVALSCTIDVQCCIKDCNMIVCSHAQHKTIPQVGTCCIPVYKHNFSTSSFWKDIIGCTLKLLLTAAI